MLGSGRIKAASMGLAMLIAIGWVGCSGEPEISEDAALARGEMIYRNVCTVCHAADPMQPGYLGPAIAGASRELVESKVLRGEYPPGHTPAQNTQQMPQFSYLEPQIGDIAAFLAAAGDP